MTAGVLSEVTIVFVVGDIFVVLSSTLELVVSTDMSTEVLSVVIIGCGIEEIFVLLSSTLVLVVFSEVSTGVVTVTSEVDPVVGSAVVALVMVVVGSTIISVVVGEESDGSGVVS